VQLTALVPQLMSAVKLGRDLLKQFGSLRAIVQAPVTALLGVKGMLDV
jgi:DNA repair protein RadC